MLTTTRFGSRDMARSRPFYDALAELLGARRIVDTAELLGYRGARGGMFLIGKPFEGEASAGNGTQAGFEAPSRAVVDAVHARMLELGGTCAGAPGPRGGGDGGFYACYFRDPDGNKLSVFRMGTD